MPNTAVKLFSADGSRVDPRESRTLPRLFETPSGYPGGVLCILRVLSFYLVLLLFEKRCILFVVSEKLELRIWKVTGEGNQNG